MTSLDPACGLRVQGNSNVTKACTLATRVHVCGKMWNQSAEFLGCLQAVRVVLAPGIHADLLLNTCIWAESMAL